MFTRTGKQVGTFVLALLLSLTTLAPARAEPPSNQDSVHQAAAWLAETWRKTPGKFFAAGTVADGVIALSAADQFPAESRAMLEKLQKIAPGYIEDNPAGLAKIIMAADIAGQDARHFLGCDRDLVKELQAQVNRPAAHRSWGPHLIAIALSRVGQPVPPVIVDTLLKNRSDGGFGYEQGGKVTADPDYTGLGISAMQLVAKNPGNTRDAARAKSAVTDARGWAMKKRLTDASGNFYWMTYSPANSTGILGSALAEIGEDISSPVRFLKAQQALTKVGAWQPEPNSTVADVMATTQAILAVAGKGYATARSTQVPKLTSCTTATAPRISRQPASATVAAGATATFSVGYSGAPAPRVSWQRLVGGKWSAIPAATSPTYRLTAAARDNGAQFRVVVSNQAGSATSQPATLSVRTPVATFTPTAPYTKPGYHTVNGRRWHTTCEKYSQTERCRTDIWSRRVAYEAGTFVAKEGWVFNNLTYLPFMTRSQWGTNPLARTGAWSDGGRKYKTECDTAATGKNTCRSYIWGTTVQATLTAPGRYSYKLVNTWVFNNIVMLKS